MRARQLLVYLLFGLFSLNCERDIWVEGESADGDGGIVDGGSPATDDEPQECDDDDCSTSCTGELCVTSGSNIFSPGQSTLSRLSFGRVMSATETRVAIAAPTLEDCLFVRGEDYPVCQQSGEVYVLNKTDIGWQLEQIIRPQDAEGNELVEAGLMFGETLALSDNILVVGAIGDSSCANDISNRDAGCENIGAIFIYERQGIEWRQTGYIKPDGLPENIRFGSSVAVNDDTIFVGVPRDDNCQSTRANTDTNCPDAGSVYLFRKISDQWQVDGYLKSDRIHEGSAFGFSLAVDGEWLAVGAPQDTNCLSGINPVGEDRWDCIQSGAVEVFFLENNTWSQHTYIKTNIAGQAGLFGQQVGLDGEKLLVSAHRDNSCDENIIQEMKESDDRSCTASGAVYAFERSSEAWRQRAYIKPPNVDSSARYGLSIGLGRDFFVVAAPREERCASDMPDDCRERGQVYLYEWDDEIRFDKELLLRQHLNNDLFGQSLALSADLVWVGYQAYDECAQRSIPEFRDRCQSDYYIQLLEI